MTNSPEVLAARGEADRAQRRLIERVQELQQRIAPKILARDAWEGAKSKGADLAEDAVDAVRARPVASAGVVTAIALFLAREPLMDLAGKLVNGKRKKAKTDKKPKKTKKMETVSNE